MLLGRDNIVSWDEIQNRLFMLADPQQAFTTINDVQIVHLKYLTQDLRTTFNRITDVPDRLTTMWIASGREFVAKMQKEDQDLPGLLPPFSLNVFLATEVYDMLHTEWRIEMAKGDNADADTLRYYKRRMLGLLIQDTPTDRYLNLCNRYPEEKDDESIPAIDVEIETFLRNAYQAAGYSWFYFGYVNTNSQFYKSRTGQVPLRPDTFEAFSLLHINPATYTRIQAVLEKPFYKPVFGGNRLPDGNVKDLKYRVDPDRTADKTLFAGWSKEAMFQAIRNSGLWKDVSKEPSATAYTSRKRQQGITYKDIGIDKPGYLPGLPDKGYNQLANPNDKRIHRRQIYLPSTYYEALYRKIFSTLTFINWPFLCKTNAIDLPVLQDIAIKDYKLDAAKVANAVYGEICEALTVISDTRLELTQNLARTLAVEAKTGARGFTMRPSSPWVNPPMREIYAQGLQPVAMKTAYDQYIAFKNICEDEKITKDNLITFTVNVNMRYLLPENLDRYSKGDLCEFLLEYFMPRAQNYEYIAFDCANPHIELRHILNTVSIMGLQSILPKDISRLTKDRVCQIITNYVNLLSETKAIRLPEAEVSDQLRRATLQDLGYPITKK